MTPAVAAAKALLLPSAALDRHAPAGQASAAATPETTRAEQRRYGFRVGGMGFLAAPQVGCEAIAMPPISPIPNSAPWLRGVMNLRGALVPIFDLAQALGIQEAPRTKQASILIFDKGAQAAGIVTDSFPRLLPALTPMKQMPELPATLSGGLVVAGYTDANEVWLELDHVRFFDSLKNGTSH
jgi:chemotaxis signal transduction protein